MYDCMLAQNILYLQNRIRHWPLEKIWIQTTITFQGMLEEVELHKHLAALAGSSLPSADLGKIRAGRALELADVVFFSSSDELLPEAETFPIWIPDMCFAPCELWTSTNPWLLIKPFPVLVTFTNHFCRKLLVLTQPICGWMRTLRLCCGQIVPCDWYNWHLKTSADCAKALLLLLLLLLLSSTFFFFFFKVLLLVSSTVFFFFFKLFFKCGGFSCVAKRFLIFTSVSFSSGFNPLAGRSIGCSNFACSVPWPGEGQLSSSGNLNSPNQHIFHRILEY